MSPLLSKGQPWSVRVKRKQAVAIQRKVILVVAAEEWGAATAGRVGASFMFSLQTTPSRSSWNKLEGMEKEKKEKEKQK